MVFIADTRGRYQKGWAKVRLDFSVKLRIGPSLQKTQFVLERNDINSCCIHVLILCIDISTSY